MRYNDLELFEIDEFELDIKKKSESFNNFCDWAMVRLKVLIEESVQLPNWMDDDVKHLRNYRIKAIAFYGNKKGK